MDTDNRTRCTTLLNLSGDSTIAWDESGDAMMEGLIRKKMAEGVTFFVVKPSRIPFLPKRKVAAGSVEEAVAGRSVSVGDADFAEILKGGYAAVVARPPGEFEATEIVTDPKVAARSQTVGVRAMAGG
jgi:hypothetical protein